MKKLFELVVRVKKHELLYGCLILVTHISGDRMQAQGTDGISRGLFKEGVSTSLDMEAFLVLPSAVITCTHIEEV